MPWVFIFLNTLHMNIPAPLPSLNSFSRFKYGWQSSMEGQQEAGGFGFNESGYLLVRKITVSMWTQRTFSLKSLTFCCLNMKQKEGVLSLQIRGWSGWVGRNVHCSGYVYTAKLMLKPRQGQWQWSPALWTLRLY